MSGYYHTNILPWTVIPEEQRRFRRAIQTALIFYVIVAVPVSIIEVPKSERIVEHSIPPQLAKLILERKEQPKPKPVEIPEKKPEEKKEVKKPEPKEEKKVEKKTPEKKPEPKKIEPVKEEPPPPPKVDIEAARRKAAKTGLFALSDDLADLRDTSMAPSLDKNVAVTKSTGPSKPSPSSAPSVLTLSSRSSGGVDTSAIASGRASRRVGGGGSGGELAGRSVEQVESPVEASARFESKAAPGKRISPRTEEEVQLIFDKYKGVIQSMYQRVWRNDPNQKGKVVLDITIASSGAVTECKIVASELEAPEFLEKLVLRVKTFNFGAKDVQEATVRFPIYFLPPNN